MNLILRGIAIAILVAPISALASTWSCTNNKLVRTVSVDAVSGTTACKVNYTKETEGGAMKTLWSAINDPAYCNEKAEGFVAKLTTWGWACTKDAPAAAPATTTTEAEAKPASSDMESTK